MAITGNVELVPYDAEWPRLYEREAARIRKILDGAPIEHVGSTSVPGLMAKPFIDMVVGIEDESGLAAVVTAYTVAKGPFVEGVLSAEPGSSIDRD